MVSLSSYRQMPGLYFELGQSLSMNIITEYHLLFDSTQPKLLRVQLVSYIAFVPMPTYVSSQSQCLHESVNYTVKLWSYSLYTAHCIKE